MTLFHRVPNLGVLAERRHLLLVFIVLGFFGWLIERKAMEFTTLTYTAGDMPETTQTLVIKSNGEATFNSHTNERLQDRPEIGLYKTVLDTSGLRSLRALLEKWPLAQLPDHTGRMPEGISRQVLQLITPQAEIIKRVSPAAQIDPRLEKVLDGLDRIALEIMKHPRRVLKAEIISPTASSSGNLSIELKLTNVGTDELWFRSPQNIVALKDGWVRIEVWPAVPEAGSMWSEQKVFIQPSSVESVGSTSVQPGAEVLLLRPHETMRFTMTGLFSGKPGNKYVARVDYCNFKENLDDQAPIVGEMWTKATQFSLP
jgi:hypothetical protein